MPAASSQFSVDLNLSDYWAVVRKRKWITLPIFLLTNAAAIAIAFKTTPVYKAGAIIKFDPSQSPGATSALAAGGAAASMMMMSPAIQTEVNLINSREMYDRVGKAIGMDSEAVAKIISGDKMGQSSLIEVTAMSTNPVKAAEWANLVADTLIAWDIDMRSQQQRKSLEELAIRARDTRAALLELETTRKDFLESHQTTGLTTSLATKVLDLETRREELMRKFTEFHPEVLKLDQRIRVTRAKLNSLPAELDDLGKLERDIKVKEATFLELSRQMEGLRLTVESTIALVSVVSRATTPDQPSFPPKKLICLSGGLLGIVLGVFAAFVLENLDISITTIEEIERVLEAPVLGIVPHFGSQSHWQDLMTTLFFKERHQEDAFRSFLVFRQKAHSPLIEVYHNLRVNIQAQVAKTGPLVLTFTSTGVAEGKTLTSTNFCLAAAHSGLKTLLIGADIRRPTLHKTFGLPKEPGLIEAITGRVPLAKTLRGTKDFLMGENDLERITAFPGIENLKIMTGWTESTSQVVNIFSSNRLTRLIEEMRAQFDIIVFDCPPVLLFVDPLLIGPHTDGTVIVYRSGKMARRALKRARDQIALSRGGRILGIVLNDAKTADMEPGYGYYSDYGHYAKPREDA